MLIGNKKVSQLIELTPTEVEANDLFLIIDSSNRESKKIQASNLITWLNGSGSIYAQHSVIADTASFILGSNVYGPVFLAALAANAISSSWADNAGFAISATSASNATTASFALNAQGLSITSSYLKYSGFPNGTSSFALRAGIADLAYSAAFLLYSGGNNGTASYAMYTDNVNIANSAAFALTSLDSIHSINADTASYFNNVIGTVASASYANFSSESYTSTTSISSSYLIFDSFTFTPNGTASYAISAGSIGGIKNYGIFLAISQSLSISQLDDVVSSIASSITNSVSIEAVGTVVIPFTSSISVDEYISLVVKSRATGEEFIIDSTPIYYNLSPTIGNWGSYNSGSIKIPYTMLGSQDFINTKHYMIYVSASSNIIYIDPYRINRFNISGMSDGLSVNSGLPLEFCVFPTQSLITFFTSSTAGPFMDIAYNIVHTTGSNNIFSINLDNLGVTDIKYVWSLSNLVSASFVSSSLFSGIDSFPQSLKYLDCASCSLVALPDLSYTSTSYLKCDNNGLFFLPSLPPTMSYINCASCSLITLPNPLPTGLLYFYCDNNLFNAVEQLPTTIISMSLANNLALTNITASLPTDLVYINVNNLSITTLSVLPNNTKFIHAQSCSLTLSGMDLICSQSYVNAFNNNVHTGSIDISGNGPLLASTINNYVIPLINNFEWSISTD